MFDPGPCVYMEKIAGGRDLADLLDLDRPIDETFALVAERRGVTVGDVIGRDARPPAPRGGHRGDPRRRRARPPHHRRRRRAALLAVQRARTGVDLLWGIGGTPEGVISAAAIKCIGGALVGRLWPRDDDERKAALDAGYDLERVLDRGRPRRRRRLLLLRDRRHRRRRAPGRALRGHRRRDDRVARDALALGDGAPGARDATTATSCARSAASATADRGRGGGGAGSPAARSLGGGPARVRAARRCRRSARSSTPRDRAWRASAGSRSVTSTWMRDCVAA